MMGQAQANRPEGQPDAKNPNKEYKLYIDQKKKEYKLYWQDTNLHGIS